MQSPAVESQGRVSPDGRWIAYASDETGRQEVYVQSFPGPGPRTQVSLNGGRTARWRHDGKELFFLAPNGSVMAVPIRSLQPLDIGSPVPLFSRFITGGIAFDVTADGQRFIVNAIDRQPDPSMYVLIDWPPLARGAKP